MSILRLPPGRAPLAAACGERFDPQQVCVAESGALVFTLPSNNALLQQFTSTCPCITGSQLTTCGTAGGSSEPNGPTIDTADQGAVLVCSQNITTANSSKRYIKNTTGSAWDITAIRLVSTQSIGAATGPNCIVPGLPPFIPDQVLQSFTVPQGVGALPYYERDASRLIASDQLFPDDPTKGFQTVPHVSVRAYPSGGWTTVPLLPVGRYYVEGIGGVYTAMVPQPIDVTIAQFAEQIAIPVGGYLQFSFHANGEGSAEDYSFQLGDMVVTLETL